MHLPSPVYNAVPAVYFIMGIATWYFAVEALVLEKGLGLAAFLSASALLLIGFGFHIKRLRHRTRTAGQTQN